MSIKPQDTYVRGDIPPERRGISSGFGRCTVTGHCPATIGPDNYHFLSGQVLTCSPFLLRYPNTALLHCLPRLSVAFESKNGENIQILPQKQRKQVVHAGVQ